MGDARSLDPQPYKPLGLLRRILGVQTIAHISPPWAFVYLLVSLCRLYIIYTHHKYGCPLGLEFRVQGLGNSPPEDCLESVSSRQVQHEKLAEVLKVRLLTCSCYVLEIQKPKVGRTCHTQIPINNLAL